jgi:hypothetical protein
VVLALLLVGVVTLDAVGRGSGRCYSPSHLGWWALGPPCGRRNPRPPRTAEARRPAASPGFSRLGLCCPEFYLNELRRREAAGRERWLLWLTAVITVLYRERCHRGVGSVRLELRVHKRRAPAAAEAGAPRLGSEMTPGDGAIG